MRHLIELGVDGIITDYPDRLRAVMAEKGMALPPLVRSAESCPGAALAFAQCGLIACRSLR